MVSQSTVRRLRSLDHGHAHLAAQTQLSAPWYHHHHHHHHHHAEIAHGTAASLAHEHAVAVEACGAMADVETDAATVAAVWHGQSLTSTEPVGWAQHGRGCRLCLPWDRVCWPHCHGDDGWELGVDRQRPHPRYRESTATPPGGKEAETHPP